MENFHQRDKSPKHFGNDIIQEIEIDNNITRSSRTTFKSIKQEVSPHIENCKPFEGSQPPSPISSFRESSERKS